VQSEPAAQWLAKGKICGGFPQGRPAQGCVRGASVLYRALPSSILERAYTPAYGHVACNWRQLKELDVEPETLAPLASHSAFQAAVRAKNLCKLAFWAQVNVRGERLASKGKT
jgi:hypothetical protein